MKLLAPFAVLLLVLGGTLVFDRAATDADLIFVNRNEVYTLDPQRMSYVQDIRMSYALYEGLIRWDNSDFSFLPAVAALPDKSEDGLTYTFKLAPAAKWSNGDPVTAHDFVFSWMRAMLPDTAADYSNMFFVVDGGREFFAWRNQLTLDFTRGAIDADAIDAAGAGSVVRRLTALADAGDLPAAIAWPADVDRAELREELAALVEAFAHPQRLQRRFRSSNVVRRVLDALEDPQSRVAEADWMWTQTQRRFAEHVGVRAADDHTLEIRLHQPTAYLQDLLAFGVFYPVHRPTVEGWELDETQSADIRARGWRAVTPPPFAQRRWVRLEPDTGRLEQRHEWTKPGRFVGNGPYTLTQWRYKRDMRLERNPYFHRPEQAQCDSISVLAIEDTNTAVLAFESGSIDWLSDVSTEYQSDMLQQRDAYVARHREQVEQLKELLHVDKINDEILAQLPPPEDGERRDIHVFNTFGTDFYSFNCRPTLSDGRPNPFADAGVRRAFTMSVDKQAIVRDVTRLNEPIATTLIPRESIDGYQGPEGLPYDSERAREELRVAGWEDRDGNGVIEDADGTPFPVIDLLWTTNTPRYKWISLELKAQWERELGVRIELRGTDTKFYKEDLKQGKFMIARGVWWGDYGDPTTFLDLCHSTDGNNDRGYKSEYVDELLDEAARETDEDKRMAILEKCERFLFDEEVPMLPLCQMVQVYMYEPGRVHGLSQHARLTQYLWQMRTERP